MHIRTFDARTLDAAQAAVRRALGDDALILATESTPAGIRITAAIETETRIGDLLAVDDEPAVDPHLQRLLAFHGVPPGLARALAGNAGGAAGLEAALTNSLRPRLKTAEPARRQVLTGPPGHGKTLTLARLAHAALAAGRTPVVLTLDGLEPTARERLCHLLRGTPIDVVDLEPAASLDRVLEAVDAAEDCLIDTAGMLTTAGNEAARLRALLGARGIAGTLVVSVEGQAATVLEAVEDFLGLGCRSVLFTKLDATRRYGALVAVAAAGVPVAPVSVSHRLEDPLSRLTAAGLARLLARRFEDAEAGR
jgi:flagellar biosynthesis protein FlhF